MKLVTTVRLFPDAAQEAALRDTLALCNQAANGIRRSGLYLPDRLDLRARQQQEPARSVYIQVRVVRLR